MRVPLMISGAIGMVVFGLSYMTVDAGTGVDFTALNSLEKDFEVAFGDAASWSSKGGVIQCTGSPNGYIVTKKSYSNYVLLVDIRFPEQAGNTGILNYITGEHKIWPACVEVQGL